MDSGGILCDLKQELEITMGEYAIVTKARPDGSFDDVGMNYRRLIRLKTHTGVVNRGLRTKFIQHGDLIRVEWSGNRRGSYIFVV